MVRVSFVICPIAPPAMALGLRGLAAWPACWLLAAGCWLLAAGVAVAPSCEPLLQPTPSIRGHGSASPVHPRPPLPLFLLPLPIRSFAPPGHRNVLPRRPTRPYHPDRHVPTTTAHFVRRGRLHSLKRRRPGRPLLSLPLYLDSTRLDSPHPNPLRPPPQPGPTRPHALT